ncbi:MAG: NPCBM/NEW2 domain-containing protein [Planctomycetaceae bacterium]|nr:NPCBM/NEW2 domain-containing protein [Planctomycetaceae bacterium]
MFLSLSVYAAEVPFEVTDADGNTVSGTIVAFDSVQLVLDNNGTKTEILTEKIVRIQNLLNNPFLSVVSGSGELSVYPSNPNMPPRKQPSKSITALFQKREANSSQKNSETETKPVFPEIVSVLELKDHTRLVITEFVTKGKSAVARLLNNEEITLPLEQLRAVRLIVKGLNEVTISPEDWQKYAAQSGHTETGDRIVVGQSGSLDVYTGILKEVGKDTISFIVDGETLPVPRRKVFGLLFHSLQDVSLQDLQNTAQTPQTPFGLLSLWNGTILHLHTLKLNENGQWSWTTVSGVTGVLTSEEINELDFGRKNAFYLTDLQPVLLEQAFFFDRETEKTAEEKNVTNALRLLRTYRTQKIISQLSNSKNNNNSNNTKLSFLPSQPRNDLRYNKIADNPIPEFEDFVLNGNIYEHGFVVPAKAVFEYSLTDSFTVFHVIAGIDDRLRPNGGVRLRIQAEQQLLGDWIFYGDEPAKSLKLTLPPNTKTLKFEVDFIKGITVPAILTLAEPKLLK